MGPIADFTFGPMELVVWTLQVLLIALVGPKRSGPLRFPEPTISFCLLVLCLGWIVRLTYLYALASDGLAYWIGDDALRWLYSWSAYNSPPDEPGAVPTWMPGTLVVHGAAMALSANPLQGSKLVSATYALMSLGGVFVFAQGLFRSRVTSLACVVFLTPFWIDILLSAGTMTEMPTAGAMLAGAGALLYGLRLPLGRPRALVLLSAAASFALATTFHMVAWIMLTGILLFLLPVFLSSSREGRRAGFRSWVGFSAISTSWCFLWLADQWRSTGSPLTAFRSAGELSNHKIGGPLDLAAVLGPVTSAGELALVFGSVAALLVFAFVLFVTPRERERVLGRLNEGQRRRTRWAAALVAMVLFALALGVVQGWLSELPPSQRTVLIANWGIFPVSLAYCLYYCWPLVLYGVIATMHGRETYARESRLVLLCMGFVFALLMSTSIMGGANVTPFRTVLVLSTALLPFAMVPLLTGLRAEIHSGEVSTLDRVRMTASGRWITLLVAMLVFGANLVANHTRVEAELPTPTILRAPPTTVVVFGIRHHLSHKGADLAALGSWLRTELDAPTHLSEENLSQPFELSLLFENSGLNATQIKYLVGDPARFAEPHWRLVPEPQTREELLAKLAPHQVLISDYAIGAPELRLIARLGAHWVYERRHP